MALGTAAAIGGIMAANPDRDTKSSELSPADRPRGWRGPKGPNPSNKSGFRAAGHRILLLPDEVEVTTASGIVLAAKTVKQEKDSAVMATILEVGHDCWMDKSTDFAQAGDRVLMGQFTGKFHTSPIDGKVYRFINDLDVISVLDI